MRPWARLKEHIRSVGAVSGGAEAPLWQICARQLWEKNVTAMSAGLSFRTIFAMVPLLVLAFLLLKTVGIVENSKQTLRHILEASGVSQIVLVETEGAAGAASQPEAHAQQRVVNVADEIERLVEGVEQKLTIGRVGPVGFLLLIYTATTLLTTMERSLNRILGAPRSRSLLRRLPLYWSVMTLGPILLATGIFTGRQAAQTLGSTTGISYLLAGATGWVAPVLAYLLVLWAVYKLLPNTEVPSSSALIGAAVATPIWLIAKWGFALYVGRFVRTGNLYGVLGLVPLFLIWLNLSWLILLFGAELTSLHAGMVRSSLPRRARDAGARPSDLLAALLAVGGPYEQGHGPVPARKVGEELRISGEAAGRILDLLAEMGLVCAVRNRQTPAYVLARPAAAIPVVEIMQMSTSAAETVSAAYSPAISAALASFYQQARSSLSALTVAHLLNAGSGQQDAGGPGDVGSA